MFHKNVGENGQLSAGNTVLTRVRSYSGACGATATPVPFVDGAWRFNVKIEKLDGFAGNLEVGFTSSGPHSENFVWTEDLPRHEGSWWVRGNAFLPRKGLKVGDVLSVALLPTGAFEIHINGKVSDSIRQTEARTLADLQETGVVKALPPATAVLFGVVGVYGQTAAVSLPR